MWEVRESSDGTKCRQEGQEENVKNEEKTGVNQAAT